ncbi:hypothetical protein LIG30_0836 [Burkholderia sp. lig30]|jgi:hypothetical protein|uniref:hypothetical protein n=1 Tax=Burkholderia sp. lig30 TaxID=1192124 RepID=UPI0004611D25|nr:hypothetical protein [Burkholderia sp. lig30]KDB10230.1 hypothetical protein LIG30_0836 [Burkholderia sp. lig30]
MAENENPKVIGVFHSYMTPAGYTQRADAEIGKCDLNVPPAADSIIGECEYYYRPLNCGYTETVEKIKLSNASSAAAFAAMKVFARDFNPWKDVEIIERLLKRREKLIPPNCTDSDWSRHSNFMMRHIGCGHKPPSYYISYGYYYCSNYGASLKPRLSEKGKDWLDNARWALQKYMGKGLMQNMQGDVIKLASKSPRNGKFEMKMPQYQLEVSEENFKKFAFKTHPLAYLDGGLAWLNPIDMALILSGPAAEEWGDVDTYKQVTSSMSGALKNYGGAISDESSELVNRALNRLMNK